MKCKTCKKSFTPRFKEPCCSDVCMIKYIENDTFKKKLKYELKKKEQREKIEYNKAKKEKSVELMSVDAYRAKYVQPKINLICRLIDYGLGDIGNKRFGKMNGGHFWDVGSNRSTALNLHNIHRQSFEANHHKSGDKVNYRKGLIEEYSHSYMDFIEELQQTPLIKLSKEDLKHVKKIAEEIIKELKCLNDELTQPRDWDERLTLRNIYNLQLGIYNHEQAVYQFERYNKFIANETNDPNN